MGAEDSTCWTLLRDAAAGGEASQARFAARYAPVVRAYLAVRWRGSKLLRELDDTVQEVFIECLRDGGLLDRARADRPGGFRAFLYGAVRNVALRAEAQRARQLTREPMGVVDLQGIPDSEEALSRVYDRAWAKAVVCEAAERQSVLAAQGGEAALRRVEMLRLRFHEGMPIREIARLWGLDAASLHHEYARARQEFRSALRDAIAFHFEAGLRAAFGPLSTPAAWNRRGVLEALRQSTGVTSQVLLRDEPDAPSPVVRPGEEALAASGQVRYQVLGDFAG